MGIEFQDRSAVASFLKDEFQDTIVNIFRSHRAGLKEKEDEQFKEESTIAQNSAAYIQRNIKSLDIGTATDQDIANIRKGIETLKISYKDNTILQSSANLLDLELNSFENLYNERNKTVQSLDKFLSIADEKIRDPYQKTSDINALITDIKKSYDNNYNSLSTNDLKFYNDKITKAFEYLTTAQKLSKMDVSTDTGLQLDKTLTELGFKNGQLTNPDAFQSNQYQSTVKQAEKAFAEGDFDAAEGWYQEASKLEVIEGTRAKDIDAVLSIYYNDDGTIKEKWGEQVMFVDPFTGIREPRQMTDLLNTGIDLAKKGQLKQAQTYLNMIPEDIEDVKKQNIVVAEDMVEQAVDKFDVSIMEDINLIDQIKFAGQALNPIIETIDYSDEKTAIRNAFNKMKAVDLIKYKGKEISSEQAKVLRDNASESIATLVSGMDKGNLSKKLQTLVNSYNSTKVGSNAHKLATNKIALYMKNNSKEVSNFDLGGPGTLELPNLSNDIMLRQEFKKLFDKYDYINNLHRNINKKKDLKDKLSK